MRPLFRDRLRESAEYAGVEYSPTAIGRALGVSKQTVHQWMMSSEPRPAMLFHIADSWNVDARWLATGDGEMRPPPGGPGLSADEIEMLKRYRKVEPRNRSSIVTIAKSLAKVGGIAALTVGAFAFNKNSFADNSTDHLAHRFNSLHIGQLWPSVKRALQRLFAMWNEDKAITA